MLRATTACAFSTSQLPKVVRPWCVLYILTSKCGSAPAALASLLFDPPEPQIIGKTQCFATFLPFHASASSFFLYSFSSTLLSSNLSLLSASSLLCFSSVHIVGSLTSKLPSNIHIHIDLICMYSIVCVYYINYDTCVYYDIYYIFQHGFSSMCSPLAFIHFIIKSPAYVTWLQERIMF